MGIVKAISGHTGARGVMRYLERDGRALARDFLNIGAPIEGWEGDLPRYGACDWAAEMDSVREAAGNGRAWRGRAARTWKHYVLSSDPAERRLPHLSNEPLARPTARARRSRGERAAEARGERSWVADIRTRADVARALAASPAEYRSLLAAMGVELADAARRGPRRDWVYSLADSPSRRIRGEPWPRLRKGVRLRRRHRRGPSHRPRRGDPRGEGGGRRGRPRGARPAR